MEQKKLDELKLNEANPRKITDIKFTKLVNSLLVSPKMLELRPIVCDTGGTILGGNMRQQALMAITRMERADIIARLNKQKELKGDKKKIEALTEFWDKWNDCPNVPVLIANGLSDEEKRAFIIKDNASFGEWDWDMLANEWEIDELNDWGVDVPTFDVSNEAEVEKPEPTEKEEKKMQICPKCGYKWQK